MSKNRVIAITNQKGGVGKTTTTVNLALALSDLGRKVCVIDYDSQASLSNALNVGLNEGETYWGIHHMMAWLLKGSNYEASEELQSVESFEEMLDLCLCRPTYVQREMQVVDGKRTAVEVEKEFGFDLIPSHLALSDYELEISQGKPQPFALYNAVQKILKIKDYDYILIDSNPSLGIMCIQVLCAAEAEIIPTNLDLMSTRGVENLIEKIADVQESTLRASGGKVINRGIIGVLLNLYSERRTIDKTIQNDMERFYPIHIFKSTIPESVKAKQAIYSGVLYSMLYGKAKDAYMSLAKEVEERLDVMESEEQKILRLEPNSDRKVGHENDE